MCSICLNELDDNIFCLPCFHTFHSECINKWLENQTNSNTQCTCPECRNVVYPQTLRGYTGHDFLRDVNLEDLIYIPQQFELIDMFEGGTPRTLDYNFESYELALQWCNQILFEEREQTEEFRREEREAIRKQMRKTLVDESIFDTTDESEAKARFEAFLQQQRIAFDEEWAQKSKDK